MSNKITTNTAQANLPSREEWLARFAQRLIDRSQMDRETALQSAEAYLEMLNYDLGEDPEDCAEEEMEGWAADC